MNRLNPVFFPRILRALAKERLVLTRPIDTKEEALREPCHVSTS